MKLSPSPSPSIVAPRLRVSQATAIGHAQPLQSALPSQPACPVVKICCPQPIVEERDGGSPTARWASVALGTGVGIGAAYTESSYIFNGYPPK